MVKIISLKNLSVVIILLIIGTGGFYFFGKSRQVVISNEGNSPIDEKIIDENSQLLASDDQEPEAETGVSDENKNETIKNQDLIVEEKKIENNNSLPPVTNNSDNKKFEIINKYISWGYSQSSGRKIDTIIIHSSYNALGGDQYSVDKLINEYKQYGVAAHYLIDRKGNIYRLVEEKNIAYHAGESKVPDGRTNVNNFSIGIELMNTKTDKFTDEQYKSLSNLLSSLKNKYKIKYVLGHNQIAPDRKDDPWNISWSEIK